MNTNQDEMLDTNLLEDNLEILVSAEILCNQEVVNAVPLETGGEDDGDREVNILILKQVLAQKHLPC